LLKELSGDNGLDICTNGVEALNLKEIVIALNDLLTAIYSIETRLSDLL